MNFMKRTYEWLHGPVPVVEPVRRTADQVQNDAPVRRTADQVQNDALSAAYYRRQRAQEDAAMRERDVRRLTYQLFLAYPASGIPADKAGTERVIDELYRRATVYVDFWEETR